MYHPLMEINKDKPRIQIHGINILGPVNAIDVSLELTDQPSRHHTTATVPVLKADNRVENGIPSPFLLIHFIFFKFCFYVGGQLNHGNCELNRMKMRYLHVEWYK